MNTFGDNVRKNRKRLGWSLGKLAQKANIARTTLSGYELNKRDPNLFLALDIARALGCSIYDLCGIKDNRRNIVVDEICDMLENLMIKGEYEIFIDTKIAKEIIDVVRGTKDDSCK